MVLSKTSSKVSCFVLRIKKTCISSKSPPPHQQQLHNVLYRQKIQNWTYIFPSLSYKWYKWNHVHITILAAANNKNLEPHPPTGKLLKKKENDRWINFLSQKKISFGEKRSGNHQSDAIMITLLFIIINY